ncbi:MAG: DUF445 domain-containing protein [Chitinophagaceae bacterium]|nr:DUF445 domain-containing protein [Chitinophagaceae bacterium]
MNDWIIWILIPLSSALIGWISISMVIYFLFHPEQPKKLPGFTIQGILPKNQPVIAKGLGKLASKEFLSFSGIEEKISSPENLEKILPLIEEHVDDFLRNRLKQEMPMISMFIGDKTIQTLKTAFMKEITLLFPAVMKKYAANLQNDLNIEQLISSRVEAVSMHQLEEQFQKNLAKEIKLAKLFGGLIGLTIGLVQALVLCLVK